MPGNHGNYYYYSNVWLLGLLAERHDDTEPTLDSEELLPGDPFSPPDNPHGEVGQDDDDDDAMPTTNMSSLEKSLQVTIVMSVDHVSCY